MILTKQLGAAAKVIEEAQAKLPPWRVARCCERMGEAYSGTGNEPEMKKWNGEARGWYDKALAAQPADVSIKRRLAEFFLRSRQIEDARKCLEEIREQGGCARNGFAMKLIRLWN